MTFLLFVTAGLVAVSGGLKLRATSRVGLGFAPLALLEMVVAMALALMILPSPVTGTAVVRWSVPVAMVIVIVSSIDHFLRLRRYRKARAESEGGRLATYVKYLSEMDDDPEMDNDEGDVGSTDSGTSDSALGLDI